MINNKNAKSPKILHGNSARIDTDNPHNLTPLFDGYMSCDYRPNRGLSGKSFHRLDADEIDIARFAKQEVDSNEL